MQLKKLEEVLSAYHEKNRDFLSENHFTNGDYLDESYKKEYDEFIETPNVDYVDLIGRLAWYNLDKAIYDSYHHGNKEEILKSLAYSSMLAYLTIVPSSQFCGCMEYNPKLEMSRAGILLGLQVLLGEKKEMLTSTQALVDSLNAKSCLIGRGSAKDVQAWFTIELISKIYDIEILKARTRYPKKNYSHYEKVLENWDTTEPIEIEKSVYTLCEIHMSIVIQGQNNPSEMVEYIIPGYEEPKINFLTLPFIQLVPYDVLAWLKLRKLKGIKNPKTFTHPLMNTPIAKMFLNIKEPLPKPKELPYAKDLLEKLKEKCPDVEIPQWLDSEDTPNTSTEIETNAQSIDTIPDDFMK